MVRSDIFEQFGRWVNQASADLNHYAGLAPNSMVYDKSQRAYVRRPAYAAQFLTPVAELTQAQSRYLANRLLNNEDEWIAELPTDNAMQLTAHGANPSEISQHLKDQSND